jgi:hypothetical protein
MQVLGNNNLYIETDKPIFVLKKSKNMQAGAPLERRGVVMPRGGTISQRGFLICCEGVM